MTDQRFPAGPEQRVRLSRIAGELQVDVWDDDSIRVQTDGRIRELYQEGDELVIDGCDDDIQLRAPARVRIFINGCDDDLRVEGVRRVEIERASGDVSLEHIAEEIVVDHISGDLQVKHAPSVSGRGPISGDVSLKAVGQASFTSVQADLRAEEIGAFSAETVDGDVHVEGLTGRLGLSNVGGDLHVEGASGATVGVGTVGGDLHVAGDLGDLQLGTVGGDCAAEGPCERAHLGTVGGDLRLGRVGELKVGNVGGDLRLRGAAERIEAGSVGGDAEIKGVEGDMTLGQVGGDLSLGAALRPSARGRAMVAGDASIALTGEPNLTLNALVSGEVRGADTAGDGRKRVSLRYGAGEAVLDLTVGGDLRIGGGGRPDSRSASAGFGAEAGREWSEFGREMGELGRELGRLGREIADEVTASLASEGVTGGRSWAEGFARKFDAKARAIQEKVEERAKRAEERAKRAEEQARVRIKINEREWQLDPERLERIKEQARRAAAEGLQGAIEAVERALSRVAVPDAPRAPTPPTPPNAPTPPTPPTAATGQTIKIELPGDEAAPPSEGPAAPAEQSEPQGYSAAPQRPASVEQERETILRMIAEGRISPEEGDLLLEALG